MAVPLWQELLLPSTAADCDCVCVNAAVQESEGQRLRRARHCGRLQSRKPLICLCVVDDYPVIVC